MAKDPEDVFEPQAFLMNNWKWFVFQSMNRDPSYNYIMPVRGDNPFDINQAFLGTNNVKTLMHIDNSLLTNPDIFQPIVEFYKVFPHTGVKIKIPVQSTKLGRGKEATLDTLTVSNKKQKNIAGLIEFNWSRTGQTAAEWRAQINATLKLYLTNPGVLETTITHDENGKKIVPIVKNGYEHTAKYLDLLYRTNPTQAVKMLTDSNLPEYLVPEERQEFRVVPQETHKGTSVRHNPDHFQIQVVIKYKFKKHNAKGKKKGFYEIEDENGRKKTKYIYFTDSELSQMADLATQMETSMFLSINNHDIEFGSSTTAAATPMMITINYIGHVSTVLSQLGIFRPTDENATNPYGGIILEQYQKLLDDMLVSDKIWYSPVTTKLEEETVYIPLPPDADGAILYDEEERSKVVFTMGTANPKPKDTKAEQQKLAQANKDAGEEGVDSAALLESLQSLRTGEKDFNLKWFYFGDLVDKVIAAAWDNSADEVKTLLEDLRFLLGPIVIRDKDDIRYSINICDLPIALETFMVWFQEKIINAKIKKLSVSAFLRNIFNSLIRGLYGPIQRQDPEFKAPQLSFTTFSLPTKNGKDQIFLDTPLNQNKVKAKNVEDIGSWDAKIKINVLQKASSDKKEKHKHYYLIYSSNESRYSFTSTLNEVEDSKKGIPHIRGVRHGPVAKIKFKKVDTPGLPEANILRAGSGQGMLRGIYNADLNLIGYPLFRPGMLVYINPDGLSLGSITAPNSLAKKLGMGGYYAIKGASYSWKFPKLTGELDCVWQTFGEIGKNPAVQRFGVVPNYTPSAPSLKQSLED